MPVRSTRNEPSAVLKLRVHRPRSTIAHWKRPPEGAGASSWRRTGSAWVLWSLKYSAVRPSQWTSMVSVPSASTSELSVSAPRSKAFAPSDSNSPRLSGRAGSELRAGCHFPFTRSLQ